MPPIDLIATQLTDPFRIALLVALVATQRRTAGVTGFWLPLAAGVVFVAVLIPMTLRAGLAPDGSGMVRAIATGLAANAILLAPILGAFTLWDHWRR